MQRATERQAIDARDESRRLAQADERRHAEAMTALDLQRQALETLIGGRREQTEALRAQDEALTKQGAALETLIVRTGRQGDAA